MTTRLRSNRLAEGQKNLVRIYRMLSRYKKKKPKVVRYSTVGKWRSSSEMACIETVGAGIEPAPGSLPGKQLAPDCRL